jgi:hypothetical protein
MEVEEAAAARAAAAERAAAAAAGPTRVVSVVRPSEMEEARRQLPIIGLEQEVMEGINRHDVVVSGADCCIVVGCCCRCLHACELLAAVLWGPWKRL